MEAHMRRVCRLAVATAVMGVLMSCGNTDNGPDGSDSLVFQILGFNGENIQQCDKWIASNVEVDVVVQSDCSGTMMAEPFTDTFGNVTVQNNEKLDITLDSYEVSIGAANLGTIQFMSTQTATGKRCTNDPTRSCAVDSDCTSVAGGVGICRPSTSEFQLRLFDSDTKARIIPDIVPLGQSFDVQVTLFGSDVVGNHWQATGFFTARFDSFDNCDCQLAG